MRHASLFSGLGGFDLAASMPHTKGKEYGLLPTCRTSSANGASKKEIELGNPKKRLETEIAMLPTPRARDWKGEVGGSRQSMSVPDIIEGQKKNGTKTGYKLQPAFAAWMMGFPENWTELPFQNGEEKASKPMETQ